ncbi:MAG: DUF1156 domain-containing protein [Chloroflexi bacterium]|nr:DUF1156 domain-containing protein [Chloroflexota bacterium]
MTDQRLIEDYIPIEAISAEARREKSIRKGHISTLGLTALLSAHPWCPALSGHFPAHGQAREPRWASAGAR